MKPEQAFWKLIKPHLPGDIERIENIASVGTPDVNMCHKGREYWLELKVDDKDPIPVDSRIGSTIDLSSWRKVKPTQLLWHKKRTSHGGAVLLVIRSVSTIYLLQQTKNNYGYYFLLMKLEKPWDWETFKSFF